MSWEVVTYSMVYIHRSRAEVFDIWKGVENLRIL